MTATTDLPPHVVNVDEVQELDATCVRTAWGAYVPLRVAVHDPRGPGSISRRS
jgi:hypothetical protein